MNICIILARSGGADGRKARRRLRNCSVEEDEEEEVDGERGEVVTAAGDLAALPFLPLPFD